MIALNSIGRTIVGLKFSPPMITMKDLTEETSLLEDLKLFTQILKFNLLDIRSRFNLAKPDTNRKDILRQILQKHKEGTIRFKKETL